MTEFRFGDETFIPGDFVSVQTVKHYRYWGIIQSIETKMIEGITCTVIRIKTLYGDVLLTADEIEFMRGEV